MDVWEYFHQRERECERLSLTPSPTLPTEYRELQGSNGARGLIIARLDMTERASISVMERVVVQDDSYIHRLEYSYFLISDGVEVHGRERDPTHDPAEHGHGRDHARQPAGRVTFKEFVEEAWEIVSDLPDLEPLTS